MEEEGATFVNKQRWDTRRSRYAASIIAAVAMVLLMAGVIVLLAWAFQTESADAPPLVLMVILLCIPAVVIFGVILAVRERLHEIGKGEIDDARRY